MTCGLAAVELREIQGILKKRRTGDFFARPETAGRTDPAAGINLAGKLAAKRAVLSALDIGGRLPLNVIEIIPTSSGKPKVLLNHPVMRRKAAGSKISLSITHTKKTAVAFCLIHHERNIRAAKKGHA